MFQSWEDVFQSWDRRDERMRSRFYGSSSEDDWLMGDDGECVSEDGQLLREDGR